MSTSTVDPRLRPAHGALAAAAPLSQHGGVLLTPADEPDPMALNVDVIIDHVKRAGAVVLKDFHFDVATFEAFSNQFRCEFVDNLGSGSVRETVNPGSDGTIQNVAYRYGGNRQRTFPLPLHADRGYVKSVPQTMFFMCQKPAARDGQTTVADGIRICEALSDATRQLFEHRRIKYIRCYAAQEWPLLYRTRDVAEVRAYCERNDMTLQLQDDGGIRTEFVRTALPLTRWQGQRAFCNSVQIGWWQEHTLKRHINFVRFEDDSEIPAEVMAEVDEVSAGLTAAIPWEAGDMAIVDNTRMLHGRREFEDESRAVLTRMAARVHW